MKTSSRTWIIYGGLTLLPIASWVKKKRGGRQGREDEGQREEMCGSWRAGLRVSHVGTTKC